MAYQPRSPSTLPGLRLRNQRTQALIRRDVIWQIMAPVAMAAVIVVVLLVLLILPVGAPVRSVWADVALIFLIMPAGVMGLLALGVLGGLVFVFSRVLREVPYYFKLGQDWAALAAYRVNGGAARVAGIIMSVRSAWAAARRAARDVRLLVAPRED